MSNAIDIIVPWVNPADAVWRKKFESMKQNKTGVKSECRYRDFGIFKYFFRCIEQNCHWARKVFLVLDSPSQVPDWLDTSNPRLRIVYHNEYIPSEMLPTFNSNVIEMFFHMIPDLSEHFVLVNDDMFFTNPSSASDYFVDGMPVDHRVEDALSRYDSMNYFAATQRNNRAVFADYTGKKDVLYFNHHLPIAYRKSFWFGIWDRYKFGFLAGLDDSNFRHGKNYTHWLFRHLQMATGNYYERDITKYEKYIVLADRMNTKRIGDAINSCKAVCLNDQEALVHDFNIMEKFMRNTMEKKFPNKCSFER